MCCWYYYRHHHHYHNCFWGVISCLYWTKVFISIFCFWIEVRNCIVYNLFDSQALYKHVMWKIYLSVISFTIRLQVIVTVYEGSFYMEGQILFIMIIAHQASAYSTVNFCTDQQSWVITYLFILWAYWIVLAVGKMKIKLLMWRIFMNIINIMYIVMVISNNKKIAKDLY